VDNFKRCMVIVSNRTDEWKISDGCVNEGVHYQEMLDTALSENTHTYITKGKRTVQTTRTYTEPNRAIKPFKTLHLNKSKHC